MFVQRKIGIFPKVIVHDFGQNLKFSHLFCLLKIHQEKVFADVLNKKEAFKEYNIKNV